MLTWLPPGPEQPAAAVLLMHGLLGDAQPLSDRLPRPALGPGVVNLHRLQDLDQGPQRGYRRQADRGILATGRGSQACHLVRAGTLHDGQGSLTTVRSQAGLTPPKARVCCRTCGDVSELGLGAALDNMARRAAPAGQRIGADADHE